MVPKTISVMEVPLSLPRDIARLPGLPMSLPKTAPPRQRNMARMPRHRGSVKTRIATRPHLSGCGCG
ncbi:MAG: hypothetical protein H5U17_05375 [Defluviimonas sp.]|nr:hypothetical protein [Defluviimonas sp.]